MRKKTIPIALLLLLSLGAVALAGPEILYVGDTDRAQGNARILFTNEANVYSGTGTFAAITVGGSSVATGTPLYAYTESDPIWSAASNLYYLQSEADSIFATGTPLYVETGTGGGIVNTVLVTDAASEWDGATGTLTIDTNDASGAGGGGDVYLASNNVFTARQTLTNGMRVSGGYMCFLGSAVTNIIQVNTKSGAGDGILRLYQQAGYYADIVCNNNAFDIDGSFDLIEIGPSASASGSGGGLAIGVSANGQTRGTAVGRNANGYNYGGAFGYYTRADAQGAGVGYYANAMSYGSAVGYYANGINFGAALGATANANHWGVGVGPGANGDGTNIAIGAYATANGSERIAIGHNATNSYDNSFSIAAGNYHFQFRAENTNELLVVPVGGTKTGRVAIVWD